MRSSPSEYLKSIRGSRADWGYSLAGVASFYPGEILVGKGLLRGLEEGDGIEKGIK
jgi:hypothetical protein